MIKFEILVIDHLFWSLILGKSQKHDININSVFSAVFINILTKTYELTYEEKKYCRKFSVKSSFFILLQ